MSENWLDDYERQRNAQQLSPNTPEDEQEFLGFIDSLGKAVDTTQQLGYSFSRVVGQATGWDALEQFGQRGVERQEEDIAEYEGQTVQATDLLKKFQDEEENLETEPQCFYIQVERW